MRLTQKRQIGILAAFEETLGPILWNKNNIVLMLHGSRTDQNLKGGDIDLLLLVSNQLLKEIKNKKSTLLGAIERKIGECRVDLLISAIEAENQSEFVATIVPKAIRLFPEE